MGAGRGVGGVSQCGIFSLQPATHILSGWRVCREGEEASISLCVLSPIPFPASQRAHLFISINQSVQFCYVGMRGRFFY